MNDRIRQVVVTLSAVFMVYGTLVGIGVLGTRTEETAGGALSATATLVAPAVRAFSIWSVIYLGLFAYVVWQWLPANSGSARARAIGWLASASMVLNAVWLLVTQVGWLWVSVGVIAVLAVVLGLIVGRLAQHPAASTAEKVVVDGIFGLYLGWVSVATVANTAATLVASGVSADGFVSEVIAAATLAVAGAIGVYYAYRLGGRLGIAAAMAWGLGWIAVGRLTTTPYSPIAATAAVVAALAVVGAALLARSRPAVARG